MRPVRFHAILALGAIVAIAEAGNGIQFVVDPDPSGLTATLNTSADTSGTLIGVFDPVEDPAGTRTKPGLVGPFGPEENLPVAVELGFGLGGPLVTDPTGGFAAAINLEQGTIAIEGLDVDLIGGAPPSVDVTISLLTESFRTRNPSSLYLGGFPITLPIGEASVIELRITQLGEVSGALLPLEPGRFSFAVAPLVELSATISLLGNEFALPPIPIPWPLAGELVLSDGVATISSMQPLEFSFAETAGVALPEFPLSLPTIPPGDETADLLFSLVLDEIGVSLVGDVTLVARAPLPSSCIGDLNANGTTGLLDLALLLDAFDCNGDCGDADLNHDGVVDARDLNLLLSDLRCSVFDLPSRAIMPPGNAAGTFGLDREAPGVDVGR